MQNIPADITLSCALDRVFFASFFRFLNQMFIQSYLHVISDNMNCVQPSSQPVQPPCNSPYITTLVIHPSVGYFLAGFQG